MSYAPMQKPLPPTSGMATASLVCGILGLLGCGGCLTSILAIIFGYVSLKTIDRGEASGRGLAISGIILGIVATIIWTIVVICYILFFVAFAGVATMAANELQQGQEELTVKLEISNIEQACEMYRLDTGELPDDLEELIESSDENWNGPYLDEATVPTDAWGQEYEYSQIEEFGATRAKLISAGPDQVHGTSDDISAY